MLTGEEMKKIIAYFIGIASLVMAISANAGSVLPSATVDYQLIVNRDDLGFSECGVRVIAGYGSDADGRLYDIRLFAQRKYAYAVMSGQRFKVSTNGPIPIFPMPKHFWIAQASEGTSLIANPVTTSDDGRYAAGILNGEKTLDILANMVNGKIMHFNLTSDQNDTSTLSFSLPIKPDSMEQLASCLTGMTKNLGK